MEATRKAAHQHAVLQMLQASRLQPDELSFRLSLAVSAAYWTEINPQLSLSDRRDEVVTEGPDIRKIQDLAGRFEKEGYLQIEQVMPGLLTGRMRECLATLRREGWPLVFGFVYDEFWLATRLQSVVRLLSAILGSGYKQIPHIWSHRIAPEGGTGWSPHTDGHGRSKRLTVWSALSDATLENGCIYLIPKDLAPPEIATDFPNLQTIRSEDLKTLLMSSRALPVSAGAIVCWDHSVIHWGSASFGSAGPRLSISQEFIAVTERPTNDESPLLDAQTLPTFSQRLGIIGRALLAYQRFEPLSIRYADLARRLVAENA